LSDQLETLVSACIDCGLQVHRELGPGLLESAYRIVLCHRLAKRGIETKQEVRIPIMVDGLAIGEGFRADVVVEGLLLIELKSLVRLDNAHLKQTLTYLRLANMPIGLLMNFGAPTFKEGLRRIVNDYRP
jgi:GxxExxY protein